MGLRDNVSRRCVSRLMARNVLCAVEDALSEHDFVSRKRAKQSKRSKYRAVTARQRSNTRKNPRT